MIPSAPEIRRSFSLLLFVAIPLILFPSFISAGVDAGESRPLLRFPDIHEDTIVFVYGEDIWRVSASGGIAQRLTLHEGEERYPKFSPDGKWIAFTGEYDGNSDVYVMDSYGGRITRVTYHPGYDQVVGWHPAKQKILFSSSRRTPSRSTRLYLINPDGTGLEELILHEAAFAAFSPQGDKIVYNKVAREHRTWKRYQGGLAQEIHLYDFGTGREENISQFRGTDRAPMWIGDKIYFSSDRDRVLNLFEYDPISGKIRQLTRHREFDIRRPSQDAGRIVYELAGDIRIYDPATDADERVPIRIRSDSPETRPYLKNVKDFITEISISPHGKRALLVARGEVFTVPQKHGPVRNLTTDPGARDRGAIWSPDGKAIAYLSDRDGEYDLYIIDAMGKQAPRKLAAFESGFRHTLRWSPDSRKLAFTDQTLTLYTIDVHSGKISAIDKAGFENIDVSLERKPISDYCWSPDGRFIAYGKMDADLVYKIYIYSLETGKIHCVSQGIFNDFMPVFTRDGRHLIFISNRRFSPTFCDFEWEMVYKDVAGIYALTLRNDDTPLLPLRSDEARPFMDTGTDNKNTEPSQTVIDFKDIASRIEAIPLPRGNYRQLAVSDDTLFFLNSENGDYNRFEYRPLGPRDLFAFSLRDREKKLVIKNIDDYRLAFTGSHIIYRRSDSVGIIESTARSVDGKNLDLSDLKMTIDPPSEWKQIYLEAWRMERDFYYEPAMHGIDWAAVREKYRRMLESASCRQDIRFVVGELIGELNTSHTYVYGGDRHRRPDRVGTGMLGVDWRVEPRSNRYRFARILEVADWSRGIIPPLKHPAVGVKPGDYLLAVNGRQVTADKNIYSYFVDTAGKQITLLVNGSPELADAREVMVKPLPSESILRYQDWVEHNRRVVEEKSAGAIGYIHLPDTYTGSAIEFPKYFYSQTRKQGLIIDGRFNGGGLDPDIFLQRLNKPIHSYWTRRYSHDQTSPALATRAHMALLTNRQAGSGGDELPYVFQFHGMGPVIGTRTWGGLVGVSMFIDMIDGSGLTAPDYRIYDSKGRWIIENEGVEPDITVDLTVSEMAAGYDAQLMTGIEYLLKKIADEPRPWPVHAPYPEDRPPEAGKNPDQRNR